MFGSVLVDPLRAAIFALAHLLNGSLGAGIVGVSFLLRLALLPLTLRLARRAAAQQRILASLKPELLVIDERYRTDPAKHLQKTRALYARHGVRPFDLPVVLGGLVRLPIVGGLYGALKNLTGAGSFAWIADLARPSLVTAIGVSVMSGASAWLASHAASGTVRAPAVMALVASGIGFFFLWHLSAGLVLSWGASSVIDLVQGAILVRERRRALPSS